MRPRGLAIFLALVASLFFPGIAAAGPLQTVLTDLQADGKIDACTYSSATLNSAKGSIPADLDQYAPDLRNAIENALSTKAGGGCDKAKSTDTRDAGVGGTAPPGGGKPGDGRTASAAAPSASGASGASVGSAAAPTGAGGAATSLSGTSAGASTTSGATAAGATPATTPGPPVAKAVKAASPEVPFRPVAAATESGAPAPLLAVAGLSAAFLLVWLLLALGRAFGWSPAWAPAMRHAWGEAGYRAGGTWGDFRDWLRLGR
jgi:hypothetical protein